MSSSKALLTPSHKAGGDPDKSKRRRPTTSYRKLLRAAAGGYDGDEDEGEEKDDADDADEGDTDEDDADAGNKDVEDDEDLDKDELVLLKEDVAETEKLFKSWKGLEDTKALENNDSDAEEVALAYLRGGLGRENDLGLSDNDLGGTGEIVGVSVCNKEVSTGDDRSEKSDGSRGGSVGGRAASSKTGAGKVAVVGGNGRGEKKGAAELMARRMGGGESDYEVELNDSNAKEPARRQARVTFNFQVDGLTPVEIATKKKKHARDLNNQAVRRYRSRRKGKVLVNSHVPSSKPPARLKTLSDISPTASAYLTLINVGDEFSSKPSSSPNYRVG